MTSAEARRLTDAAEAAELVTMCPFTYRFMPVSRWLKELVEDGYLGRPYHLNPRYFADYGRSGKAHGGSTSARRARGSVATWGRTGRILARWYFGEIAAVTAVFGRALERGPRPDGATYDAAEDSATILLEFQSGATGSLHVSAVAHEPPFGQLHQMELHGSRARSTRSATGIGSSASTAVVPASPTIHELPIPDRIFDGARRDIVADTHKDTFRDHDFMARGFVTAIATGTLASPDFRDGLAVQRVVDAASQSARSDAA